MNTLSRYMQNYLIYGFPFMIGLIIWSIFLEAHSIITDSNIILRILNELLSYNLMLWFTVLVLYMVFLVIIPSVRNRTLSRLANLQERDEREEYITGKAARAAYIATLSLTLFFLFFSLTSFNFSKLTQTKPQQPKLAVNIGIHYNFFSSTEIKKTPEVQANTIFDSKEFSLSSSTILIIFLGWQLLMFNLAARRESMKDLQ